VSDVPALPESTGDDAADEDAWTAFRDLVLEKAVEQFHETTRIVSAFFATDKGRAMESELQTEPAAINAHLDEEAQDVLGFEPSRMLDNTDAAAQAVLLKADHKAMRAMRREKGKAECELSVARRALEDAQQRSAVPSQDVTAGEETADSLEVSEMTERLPEIEQEQARLNEQLRIAEDAEADPSDT
jgi:hypothetical protein